MVDFHYTETLMNTINNGPIASTLINSMRSIGYDFESAIADIIDNSISAKATKIDLVYPMDYKEPFLYFIDNGVGMTNEELIEALRFGSNIENRTETDLGRFGLGLKTASISQCRKLTVISKKDCEINGYSWDLDFLKNRHDWSMIKLAEDNIKTFIHDLDLENNVSFTIVMWNNFDVFHKSKTHLKSSFDVFINHINEAFEHCSLIFHEYISAGIAITFNGRLLNKVDPFLSLHHKTDTSKPQKITVKDKFGNNVKISLNFYVLPYLKDLTNEDKQLIGGNEMLNKQGFYIYRNKRLMIYGTWFRMQKASGISKNVRVKINIPNSLDDMWGIDVKKQKAMIPPIILEQLKKEVELYIEKSKRVYTHQGTTQIESQSIWISKRNRDNSIQYHINRESPIIKNILSILDDQQLAAIDSLFNLIGVSIPYIDIHNSVSANLDINPLNEEKQNEILQLAINQFYYLRSIVNINKEELVTLVLNEEPFKSAIKRDTFLKELTNEQ